MVKLVQVKDHEVLVAMSFWGLGYPMTCMIGFVLSGLKATSVDEKVVSVSTTLVDGLSYGPANLLLFGVTLVIGMFCYSYIRFALRLQLKEIPTAFTVLYFAGYTGYGFLVLFPPVKTSLGPYDYGIQYLGFQLFMIGNIAWMGYFSQWFKDKSGRACFLVGLTLGTVLLVISWVLAGSTEEKISAPVEWSSLGVIMGCFCLVIFICERDKVMKLNSSGFSSQVSEAPQEYEEM